MMKRAGNRRRFRNYFVRRDIQLKITLSNFVHTLTVVAILIAVVLFPLYRDMLDETDAYVQLAAAKLFLDLLDKVAIALIVIFTLAFVQQVLLIHKFCGPLVNFTQTFKRLMRGDLTRKVFLRKGDFLKEEARYLNQIMAALSQRIGQIREDNRLLLLAIEQAGRRHETQDPVVEVLRPIKTYADRCEQGLSEFILLDDRDHPEAEINEPSA